MKRSTLFIAIIVIVVVVLIAWRSSSGTPQTASTTPEATTTAQTTTNQPSQTTQSAQTAQPAKTTSAVPAGKTVYVSISNYSFVPATLSIAKGTTVVWTNHDSMPHTVTAAPGGPSSKELSKGVTYSFTFNTPGTVNYHCSIHPGMLGTVFVTE
ncbi:MAG TPA: cupredoxin family copper-binding protein [Candidatus Paceibacterota bacterium]|nr:cupredoxin family copper-binding protein [Candidatus Paceibacterota bacterium]